MELTHMHVSYWNDLICSNSHGTCRVALI